MRTLHRAISLVVLLIAAGCASPTPGHIEPGKITRVSLGMTKDQVVQAIGTPESQSASANTETLYYVEERPWWQWATIQVKLVDGKVTEYGPK